MFKILVADDEDTIRKGIIAILKRALDTDTSFLEACDGAEALELCRQQRPRIIITDIRMPRMNGLEFIKSVTDSLYSPSFIILSGYAEFDYAKSAIAYGVREYLLKPINKQELVSIVKKHVERLAGEEERMKEKYVREGASERVARTLRHELSLSLLNSSSEDETESYLERLAELDIKFNKRLCACALVDYMVDEQNISYIDFAVKNVMDEILGQESGIDPIITIQYDSGRYAAVFEGQDRDTMLSAAKKVLDRGCGFVKRNLGNDIFAGIGEIIYGPALISRSFDSASKAAGFKLYRSGGNVAAYAEMPLGEAAQYVRFDDMISSLENMNSAAITAQFESLLLLPPSLNSLSAVRDSYSKLIASISKQMQRYNFDKADSCSLPEPAPFHKLWSFIQLKREVMEYIEQVQECACEATIDVSNKKLILDVLHYVKENASKDINLNIVSEHFSRTPAYMSALFKKGAGENFNAYLTSIRIDMAKEMLADSTIPIGDVSSLCGYPNAKYFSVVFKKATGVSPAAFRQNSIGRLQP